MTELRTVDPVTVWLRHVVRGDDDAPTAKPLGAAVFVYAESDGRADLNGQSGWQTADVTLALSNSGSFTLALPNTEGNDGTLHRRRFSILTDPNYQPGEEWIEVWIDAQADEPLFVGTPTTYNVTPSSVTISGSDLGVVLEGAFSSDTDHWDPTGPADVIDFYTRVPVLRPVPGFPVTATDTGAGGYFADDEPIVGLEADAWSIETQYRWLSPDTITGDANHFVTRLRADDGSTITVGFSALTGDVVFNTTSLSWHQMPARRQGIQVPGPVTIRIVGRQDRIYVFVGGQLVVDARRPAPYQPITSFDALVGGGGTAILDHVHAETLVPFAARGPSARLDRRLPGIQPATGLRAQYYNAAATYAQNDYMHRRLARLFRVEEEPATDRVEPTVAHAGGAAPGLPGAFAARWSGAIYLDLAAGDVELQLDEALGPCRLYVGRTRRDEAAIDEWYEPFADWFAGTDVTPSANPADHVTGSLRDHIGSSDSGWYPIVIELTYPGADVRLTLKKGAVGGSYTTVPQTDLSPLGVFAELVRLENHRQVIGDVAEAFGYQWRLEPRGLQSDEFPGQLTLAEIIGNQTDLIIDDEDLGTDVQVSGDAGDVIDGLLVDGAGTASSDGAGQLTVQAVDYDRAHEHMALRQTYESLAEISEDPLLQTRASSLLALRSSPNEQVGVRPRGQRDLVDTFPLTGDVARMDWRPGDGVRLQLDSVDVVDRTPRQMTTVAWSATPHALGVPTVGWRQRPRNARRALRRLVRSIYGPRRYYQGGRAIVTGTAGSSSTALATDGYSRVPLPATHNDVVKVFAVVRTAGTGYRLEVGGTDLGADGLIAGAGRYDITRHVVLSGAQIYARLIGGSGTYELTLELWVRV